MQSTWPYGPVVLGCGTFGGLGGSPEHVGRGLDEIATFATLDEAIDLGITLFDTAERYALGASETMIGRWLDARGPSITGGVRIATKVAPPHMDGPEGRFDLAFLDEKFSGSLERLGIDGVELLLTHAPDDSTPIEETLEGLETIRASGRCAHLGACNVDAAQLTDALDAAQRLGVTGFEVVQNGYSLLDVNDHSEVRRICAERGLAFTPFSPLAGGVLTGKYRRGTAPPPDTRLALRPEGADELLTAVAHDAIDQLREMACSAYGVECGALALAWLMRHPEVAAPVVGPSRRSAHLVLAKQALDVELADTDFAEIRNWFIAAAEARE